MSTSEMTTFISLFHSADRAEQALNALEAAGFTRSAITSTWKGEASTDTTEYAGELTQIGVPARDLKHFEEVIRNGGVAVSLQAPESRSDDIESIFHRYTADKIDETDADRAPVMPAALAGAGLAGAASSVADDAVVPVVAEELAVGKRAVDRGGVRVFQRTVEQPVSESVNLHEEHVVFERRPVDRAVTDADLSNAGRTIELTETDEVPVISKTARVVEEVHVGKQESDRVETVQDTIRHTEVEIEQVEGGSRSTGTSTLASDPKKDRL